MRIATFNVNGIRARANVLADWLDNTKPDVVLLQEIKTIDKTFPREFIEDRGYNIALHGQKAFNGVAILSKHPIEDIGIGLPGNEGDEQARWIEATITFEKTPIRICCLYAPNGNPTPGAKYDYKLEWMEHMYSHAKNLLKDEIPTIMAGDYNVIPSDIDAADPIRWKGDALFLPETKAAFRKIINLGYSDSFRKIHEAVEQYTFWDYQAGAWNRNDGIRIDHFLINSFCADLLVDCKIDSEIRGHISPSDHVPIWIELSN